MQIGWVANVVSCAVIITSAFLSWREESKDKRRIFFCIILGFAIANALF